MSHFRCSRCGSEHEASLAYAFAAPAAWYEVPEQEREQRVVMEEELCAIDGERFFIKGILPVPITGQEEPLQYLVWAEVSRAGFEGMVENWERAGREEAEPFVGELALELPGYPSTLGLKVAVHTRPVGERPWFELGPGDHPLVREQVYGIGADRLQVIAEENLHE